MNSFWFIKIFKLLAFLAFFILVIGTAVMIIWNVLMPDLFGLPNITFGQAIGLTILARLLTGGFRTSMMYRSGESWEEKRKMWEKWSQMTPEERERWKVEWRERCNHRRPIGWKTPEKDAKDSDQI